MASLREKERNITLRFLIVAVTLITVFWLLNPNDRKDALIELGNVHLHGELIKAVLALVAIAALWIYLKKDTN